MKKIITLVSLFFLVALTAISGQAVHAAAVSADPVITGISLKLADGSTINATQKGSDFTFDLVGVPDQAIQELDFTSPTATVVSFAPFDQAVPFDTNLHFDANGLAYLDKQKFINWLNNLLASGNSDAKNALQNESAQAFANQLFTVDGFRQLLGASVNPAVTLFLQDADGNQSPQNNLTFLDEGWKLPYYYGYNTNGVYGKYTGWHTITGKRYFFNRTTGALQNGLIVDGNYKYYDVNGKVYTGWVKVGTKWYFFDKNTGAARTGWWKDGTKWYYLNNDVTMATGWVKVANKWYFLNSNGAMATGWVKASNKWYYLNSNGAMATGWAKVSGQWYYLYSDGHMAVNTFVGKHKIGKTGAMLY